mgnify:CR=1 FL=1
MVNLGIYENAVYWHAWSRSTINWWASIRVSSFGLGGCLIVLPPSRGYCLGIIIYSCRLKTGVCTVMLSYVHNYSYSNTYLSSGYNFPSHLPGVFCYLFFSKAHWGTGVLAGQWLIHRCIKGSRSCCTKNFNTLFDMQECMYRQCIRIKRTVANYFVGKNNTAYKIYIL